MKDQASITVGEVKDKLFNKYEETVVEEGGKLEDSGRDAFKHVIDVTIGRPNSGVEQNWGRDHGFLYDVAERLAARAVRYADKKDHTNEIKKKHVNQAANCLIPDISRYCGGDRVPDGPQVVMRGPYCKEWEELPEE